MATGSGKTTVMGMLAAWSISEQDQQSGDARFSDVVRPFAQTSPFVIACRNSIPSAAMPRFIAIATWFHLI